MCSTIISTEELQVFKLLQFLKLCSKHVELCASFSLYSFLEELALFEVGVL